jgi:ribonuclease P protein component
MTTRTTRFRPHERIKEPTVFRRAFERRRWESDATLTIYGLENGLDHPRLGISVSRKKVKTAAARNRLKRLIREAFRLSKPDLPAGLDLIVIPRNPSAGFAEVRRSVPELARRLERRMRSRKP